MFGVGSIILKGPGINYKRHETGERIGIFFSNFFLSITGEGFCKLNLYVQVVRTAGPAAKLLSSSRRSLHAYNVKISPCTNILRRPQANHDISTTHRIFEVFIFFLATQSISSSISVKTTSTIQAKKMLSIRPITTGFTSSFLEVDKNKDHQITNPVQLKTVHIMSPNKSQHRPPLEILVVTKHLLCLI